MSRTAADRSSGPGTSRQAWDLQVPWPTSPGVRVYDLAHGLEPGIPHHPNHPPYSFTLTKQHGEVMYPDGVSAAAEMITTGGHVGTHVDGLGHVSKDGKLHGGADILADQSYTGGVGPHSVHTMAPLLARGHLVDATRVLGRDLEPGDAVDADVLAAWFADQPEPAAGDVVLVRTGWGRHWHDVGSYLDVARGNPGVTAPAAAWLTDRGIAATGADTIAYERLPSPALEVHVHLLVDHGVPIMEAMALDDLAADAVWQFFFMAAPLPLRGGTGSPIRPLAIVEAAA
jgi:kynurenine formamidase